MQPPPARLLLLLCGVSLLCAARPGDLCPRKLDCSLLKRHFCTPGSDTCGSCLPNHVETEDKKCVSVNPKDSLTDGDIDYLAALLHGQDTRLLQKAEEGPGSTTPRENDPNALPVGSFGKTRAGNPDVTRSPSPTTKGAVKGSPVIAREHLSDALLLGLVVACTVAGLTALVVATVCWCRLRKEMKLAEKTDYSTNKAVGPPPYEKSSPVDKKLAQSAQMYHYQHQKQQMLSMEKTKDEPKLPDSNTTSDEENEDGDFTVYECPGLAPTGEMEVKNPLFDDSTLHHPSPKSQ